MPSDQHVCLHDMTLIPKRSMHSALECTLAMGFESSELCHKPDCTRLCTINVYPRRKKITNATKDTAKNCSNNCLEILISPSFPECIPYNSLIINANKVNSSLLTSESKDIC